MAADDTSVCVRPFNHLLFLFITVIGGLFGAGLALAFTQANGLGKFILFILFAVLCGAQVYCYWAHIKLYREYNRSYPYKPSDRDMFFAMFVQTFILVAWALFSLYETFHVHPFGGLPGVVVTPPSLTVAHPKAH